MIFLLSLSVIKLQAQAKIVRVEYYVDADPGLDNATALSFTPGVQLTNLTIAINPISLSGGIHQVGIRAKDSLGKWSLTNRLLFIKLYASASGTFASRINYAEWFLDADPGIGGATPIPVTPSGTINGAVVSINPALLTGGVHQFNIRVRDSIGNWSLNQRLLFIKPYSGSTNPVTASNIIYAEWYLDSDPGRGNATSITINPSTNTTSSIVSINPATSTEGVHQLNIRVKDSIGNWSLNQRLLFLKPYQSTNAIPPANLAHVEYYIDTDPGWGNGTAVSFSAGTNINNLVVSVNSTGLSLGSHKLFLRAKDSSGKWSLVNTASFVLISPNITVDSFNASICAGTTVNVSFTLNGSFNSGNIFTAQLSNATGSFSAAVNIGTYTGNSSGTINATIPASTAAGTAYRVRILASLPADTSAPNSIPVTIKRTPSQGFTISGAGYTCTDTQAYQFSPVQQAVQYSWQLPAGGMIDTSSSTPRVIWSSAGLYPLILTSSNSCGTGFADTLDVRVFNAVPALTPVITKAGNTLYASRQSAANGVLAYQWYKGSVLIAGANDTSYTATANGQYSVKYTNTCGAGPSSAAIAAYIPVSQTITFPAIAGKTYGGSAFIIYATATSSLPVRFSVLSGPALIHGDTVIITGAGPITVQAAQAGDSSYAAATPVNRSFNVAKATQTINFLPTADKIYGDAPFTVTASASTGLPVSYSILSGNATVNSNTIYLTGGGALAARATQQGNQNYLPVYTDDTFCIGARQPDTIRGYATSCISTQRYYVDSVAGFNYAWTVSGASTLSPFTGGATAVSWSATGTSTLTVGATTGCSSAVQSKSLGVQVVNPQLPGSQSNLYPADSAVIGTFPYPFSWAPVSNALLYDLYIWPDGSPVPAAPMFANLSQIGIAVYSYNLPGFTAGKRYFWKVIAKNACNQTSSVTKSFRISDLPDLMVAAITSPDTVFSGQNIAVSFTVKNIGRAGTHTPWYDGLYLSADTILNTAVDYSLGSSFYLTALDTQQSYTRSLNVNLPVYTVGNNYIIAVTNTVSSSGVPEVALSNNTFYKNIYINLSPLPDLRVTSAITSGNTFSGQNLSVSWQVKNHGPGNTPNSSWKDYVYISPDSAFNINSSIKLGEAIRAQGILYHDSAYLTSKTFVLPDQVFGKYYVYVVTDAANNIYESAFENNNTGKSDSLNIYLTPPPDYVIDDIHAPLIASRGETISVDWTVRNAGAIRQVKDSFWTDIIRVSADSVIGVSNYFSSYIASPPLVLHPICSQYALGVGGCRYITPVMDAEDTYYQSGKVTLPSSVDSAYIYVKTDDPNRIFEHRNEGNNLAKVKVRFINPDLLVTGIQSPAAAMSGGTVTLSWTIKNNGPGKVINLTRADYVYLSPAQAFNTATSARIAAFSYNNSIDSGNTLSLQKPVTIPDSLSGAMYFFVKTDANDSLHESNNNNNLSAGAAIQITMPPPPDLYVTQVAISPNSFASEHKVGISYTVKNQGLSNLSGKSWNDKVYISRLPAWNIDSAVWLKTVPATLTLYQDSSYTISDSLFINTATLQKLYIDSANCYFYVWTDADKAIFENTNENNNVTCSGGVYALQKVHPDLTVISASAPDSLRSGSSGSISWIVKNIGGITSPFTSLWYDGLYLSLDTVLGSTDLFIKNEVVSGPLDTNMQYSRSMNFTVPNGLSGYYHLLLVADNYNFTSDRNRSNNYKIIHDHNGVVHPSYITLIPPPDLVVDSLVVPAIGYSGQPFPIKWKIRNQGIGATGPGAWVERFYLSTDTILNSSDPAIASYSHSGVLPVGGLYTDSVQVFMPIGAQGNYYLLMKTDVNDVVYEHGHENNNVASVLTFIIQPLPSDLIVSNVGTDTAAVAGDSASVSWVVENKGVNPATGYMSQGIYLSSDTSWSNDDILLKYPQFNIALSPGDTLHHATRFRVKDVSAGDYYTIVRTDLLNNIFEQDETNNTDFSSGKINVGIMRLPVDTTRYNVLKNNYELYYRIDIPDSLAGETLSVTLKGDSVSGANELYLRLDTIPTRAIYDFVFDKPLSGNQQIIIPILKKGTYYLLAYGATTALSHQQPISLLAQKINFSITGVTANQGGNTGNVTIKLTGAKFQPGMKAWLYQTSLGTITANSIYYVNPTVAFATFNLAGRQMGTYHVKLVKPGIDSASALNAFTIVKGSGGIAGGGTGGSGSFYCAVVNTGVEGLLGTDVQHPASTLIHQTFPMTIIYGNSGDVDIPIPTRMLVSTAGYPVSFSSAGLADKKNELYMEFAEVNGPPNMLRPGAIGYITIFTSSTAFGTMGFKLIE